MNLLDMIFGNQATGVDPLNDYLSSIGVSPTSNSQPPVFGGGSQGQPGGAMSMAQAAPPPMLPQGVQPQDAPQAPPADVQQPDMMVTADRWKPKHRTTLGAIADIIMGTPAFAHKAEQDSIKSAMEGFQDDPMRTIRRIAKVNPEAAWQMYNTYEDNARADKIAQRQQDNVTFSRGVGLLSAANERNWPAVKQRVQNYWQSQGFDPGVELPDQYDPEAINSIRESAMSAHDQLNYESMDEDRDVRRDYFTKNIMSEIENRSATRKDTNWYRQQRLDQFQQGLGEQHRHNEAMEGTAQERADKAKDNNPKAGKQLMTKYGPMDLSPDGTKGRLTVNGETHFFVKTGPNSWQKVK